MNVTYDLYAETNPAFIAYLLQRFVLKYRGKTEAPPHISLSYLAVPIALTGNLESTFSGTNSRTGFLPWISRFPEVRIGLHSNLVVCKDVTLSGIKAGVHGRLLTITEAAHLNLGSAKSPPESLKGQLPDAPKACVSRIERLGGWMAEAGNAASIFSALEVQP
jgi:hypothetical protein